jgi:Zn-dependent metalloprotease
VNRSLALLCTTTLTAATLTASLTAALGATSASAAPSPQDRHDAAVAHAAASIAKDRGRVAAGPDEAFTVKDVLVDPDGTEHVRYDRSYRGLPVLGGDVVVHDAADGSFRSVSKTQKAELRLSTTPSVSADRAAAVARAQSQATAPSVSTPTLAVDARGASPRLAWDTVTTGTLANGDPTELHVLVDAADGAVLDSYEGIETAKPQPTVTGSAATASGRTLYDGTVTLQTVLSSGTYNLQDTTRGSATTSDLQGRTSGSGTLVTSTTGTFGNGTTSDRASAAADAAYGVGATWDYYKATFGRTGIKNDGRGAASRVHYGSSYNNAFWSDSCFCMTFGDGDGTTFKPLVALDVAGHEMTHGVTSATANLTYSGESGGLNEATSDIFGTMVEFRSGGTTDPGDYTIGEKIVPTGAKPLRWMYHPSLDGSSPNCYTSTIGSLNVHYSSGLANRAFFLLAEGSGSSYGDKLATCNGTTVTGIGRTQAAAVWYKALTTYMTSSTTYSGARAATLNAARDLGYSTTAVAAVWDALLVK